MSKIPKIGLALSGGGVRGFVHLGVLGVLENAKVPIDFIVGTSMGGIIAGVYAAGVPLDTFVAFSERIGIMDFASRGRGWRGLFGHEKMQELLVGLLDSDTITFEDLKIPTAVVATDLETGELVILNQGPLIPALMATSAFPFVFTPVYHQGRWLVDGGVLNNFPVDIARQMGADRVLGVNTPPSVNLTMEKDPNPSRNASRPSARALFSLNLSPPDWKLPFLIAETSVAFTIKLVNQVRLTLSPPDVLLEVPIPNVGVFTTDKSTAIIEKGRKATLARMSDIVNLYTQPLPPPWRRRLVTIGQRLRRAWKMFQEPEYPLYPPQ